MHKKYAKSLEAVAVTASTGLHSPPPYLYPLLMIYANEL